jgi:hypothetical protein
MHKLVIFSNYSAEHLDAEYILRMEHGKNSSSAQPQDITTPRGAYLRNRKLKEFFSNENGGVD